MLHTDKTFGFPLVSPVIDLLLSLVIITVATGAMRHLERQSKLETPPDVSLARWRATTASLQEQYQTLLRELQRLQASQQLPHADLETIQAERERIEQELKTLKQKLAEIENKLRETTKERSELDEERQKLSDELNRLRKQIEALETQLHNTKEERERIERSKKQLEEMLGRLKEAQKEHRNLEEGIAAEKARQAEQAVVVKIHPRFVTPDNLERELVVISHSTVTPVNEPYYKAVYSEFSGHRVGIGYDFVRPGAEVSESLRPGSDFLRWLDTLDPARQFVFIFVDSTSFETFRAVRAELRQRKIPCGWEPYQAGHGNIRFGADSQKGIETGIQK